MAVLVVVVGVRGVEEGDALDGVGDRIGGVDESEQERPAEVLEIGTATGYLTAEMAKLGCAVTGAEQDPKMAEILDTSRDRLPGWLANYVPYDASDLQVSVTTWLLKLSDWVRGPMYRGRSTGFATFTA